MIGTVKSEDTKGATSEYHLGVSVSEIKLWKKARGGPCKGCLRGKMTERPHKSTSRTETNEPGAFRSRLAGAVFKVFSVIISIAELKMGSE